MKKLLSLLLVFSILICMLPCAFAEGEDEVAPEGGEVTENVDAPEDESLAEPVEDEEAGKKTEMSVKEQIAWNSIEKYEPVQAVPDGSVKIYVDGILRERGLKSGDTLYVSVESLGRVYSLDFKYTVSEDASALELSCEGLELSIVCGEGYATANNRYLYTRGCFMIFGNKCYIPADIAAKALGLRYEERDGDEFFRSDSPRFIEDGKEYYKKFSKDDVFWLSRIIYAESMNQPLEANLGVGNVVLNRVADKLHYPDTIKKVVFDDVPVVQFDVTTTGGIYLKPSEIAVIAAYMCLDGENTVADSTFFVNPYNGDDSWFKSALRYVCSCGLLDFYAEDRGEA